MSFTTAGPIVVAAVFAASRFEQWTTWRRRTRIDVATIVRERSR
jgi:hypothetical protein